MSTSSITLAIADDHELLRKELSSLLSNIGFTIVLEAANGTELIAQLTDAAALPDICIIDVNMPYMDGRETSLMIKARWPAMKILAISFYKTQAEIDDLLTAGASSFLLKDSTPAMLRQVLEKLYTAGN